MASGAPDWWIQGIIPLKFLNLSDTPGDYIDRAGLVPEVNAAKDGLEWSDALIDAHKSRHVVGGADALAHSDLNPSTSDHHVKFTAAEARAAINDIFGSDGKADKDVDLDTNILFSGRTRLGQQVVNTDGQLTHNAYWDDPNWKYIAAGYAFMLTMEDDTGNIIMYTAPSGSADGTITFTARFTLSDTGALTSIVTYNGINISKPITLGPQAFIPSTDTMDWNMTTTVLQPRTVGGDQTWLCNIQMPHGATVTELKLYGYRNDASSTLVLQLARNNWANTSEVMAQCTCDWTSGWSSMVDSTISNATIDNDLYNYFCTMAINPNDAVSDAMFTGCKITF